MNFEWNDQKAVANLKKHRVSFEEAIGAFFDPNGLDFFDEEHSTEEERFIRIGCSKYGRILWIIYTERQDTIRIITARKAETKERKLYDKNSCA